MSKPTQLEEIKSAVDIVFNALDNGEDVRAILDSPAYESERKILGVEEEEE